MSISKFALRFTFIGILIAVLWMLVGSHSNSVDSSSGTNLNPDTKVETLQNRSDKLAPGTYESKQETESYQNLLKRFDTLRSRVLLKQTEVLKKERLLSNSGTVQWIESQLSQSPIGMADLAARLSMIDFFEEALSWKDNPIRDEVLQSIERILDTDNLSGTEESRRMVAGDKVELFAILTDQAPDSAKSFLRHSKDNRMLETFRYAMKRLGLKKLSGEDQ